MKANRIFKELFLSLPSLELLVLETEYEMPVVAYSVHKSLMA